ncbi:MAG: hypothetical protein V4635_14695, partial [Bacteroidota bacterium]
MTNILIKNKITDQSNIVVITEKFVNEFNLPDKVHDYITAQLKLPEKKTLTYNYIGKYISIYIVDKVKDKNKSDELLRRHGAMVADAVNAHKGKDVYIYNQTKVPDLSLPLAEGIYLANYQFIGHKTGTKIKRNTLES